MKILLSNDDGYQAPGIVALYEAIKDLGDVEVVAPEHNNSAKSNALTLALAALRAPGGQWFSLRQRHACRLRPRGA